MFLKTECAHCGQSIEFPDELKEQTHPCPKCQQPVWLQTRSTPRVPREFALGNKRPRQNPLTKLHPLWILLIIGVVIAGTLALLIKIYGVDTLLGWIGLYGVNLTALIIGLGALVLIVFWVLFPVLVYQQLKAIERAIREQK